MSEGEKKVTLKLLVDTRARKVLFAEARKDFVDFLFHILSLPMGTFIELGSKEGMVGCLGDLCKSIEALDVDYLQPNVIRDMVTEPIVIGGNSVNISHNLMLLIDAASPKFFYRCASSSYSSCRNFASDNPNANCPICNSKMSASLTYVAPKGPTETTTSSSNVSVAGGGYVKGVVNYMVMDNLEVKPMSTIALINKFNVKDASSLVEKQVQVGLKEWLAILKASMDTRTALTTVFLGNKQEKSLGPKRFTPNLLKNCLFKIMAGGI